MIQRRSFSIKKKKKKKELKPDPTIILISCGYNNFMIQYRVAVSAGPWKVSGYMLAWLISFQLNARLF